MHKAKNVIIGCIDFRFQKAMQSYLLENNYLNFTDEIVVAGAARDLIKPMDKNDGKYLWKQLNISITLHNPDNIIICGHQDCGGWAQDNTIPSGLDKSKDLELHKKFWKTLKKELTIKYPDKKIIFWYIDINMNHEEVKL